VWYGFADVYYRLQELGEGTMHKVILELAVFVGRESSSWLWAAHADKVSADALLRCMTKNPINCMCHMEMRGNSGKGGVHHPNGEGM
jgi:hypothetical protein